MCESFPKEKIAKPQKLSLFRWVHPLYIRFKSKSENSGKTKKIIIKRFMFLKGCCAIHGIFIIYFFEKYI